MVHLMVERATNSRLTAPDWAINVEISDVCNQDHGQAKDIIRSIKKRLGSKIPKVQLLALTLLEAIVKNGVDIVHMHVAEKDLPREMVKLMRKRPESQIKEKILTLIDTWQESFGGPGARYPQFLMAYQDLLMLGEVFPQRPEKMATNLVPPQTHPQTSHPQNLCNPKFGLDAIESSVEAEFPTLSLTEIQNARGALDVLTEMLNAIAPSNKEGVKQEAIVDLVEQCRTYKQRVVHFVNSSSDESLLRQGLALNDDLRGVLAKHESIASGAISSQLEKSNPKISQQFDLVDETPLVDTGDIKQSDRGSILKTSSKAHLLLLDPHVTTDQLTTPIKADPRIDLLSGDDFNSPTTKSLALVLVGQPQSVGTVASQQNAMALFDVHSSSNNSQSTSYIEKSYSSSPQVQYKQDFESPQASSHANDSVSGPMASQHHQSLNSQQDSFSSVNGSQSHDVLPPPPWETQLDNIEPTINLSPQMEVAHTQTYPSGAYLPGSQIIENDQAVGVYVQPVTRGHVTKINNLAMPSNQMSSGYPQFGHTGYMHPQQMYGNQNIAGNGYNDAQGPQQNAQFYQQSMSEYVRDDHALITSYSSNPPYMPFGTISKPEDKLFGDLVKDVSKFKPAKTKSSRGGSV